jgi:hypothetical protein
MAVEDIRASTVALRSKKFRAATLLLIVVGMGCRQGREATKPEVFPLDRRTGWFHGACLAMSDPNLARGTAVNLVVMAEPQRVLQGRIGEKKSSAASCAPLTEGRRSQNAKPGTSFYGLEGTELAATDMGIGIVTPPQKLVVVNGLAQTDLNSDGLPEVFSSCTTTEGINFTVSTEKPYQGNPLWSGYYYLGYDMEPTCR